MTVTGAVTASGHTGTCAVAVDVALLTIEGGRLHLLLVEPDTPALAGRWALPGRRVRDDEGLADTAHRALAELAGVTAPDAHLEQLATYGDPHRDPGGRVVSVAHLALTPTVGRAPRPARASASETPAHEPGRVARTWPVAELRTPAGPRLAYDHDRIVADALERARAKLEYTSLATAFVQEPFTLGELRRVYETVWGVALDPANFRRKVVSTPGFVVEAGGFARPGRDGGRPARHYRRGGATRLHPSMPRP